LFQNPPRFKAKPLINESPPKTHKRLYAIKKVKLFSPGVQPGSHNKVQLPDCSTVQLLHYLIVTGLLLPRSSARGTRRYCLSIYIILVQYLDFL